MNDENRVPPPPTVYHSARRRALLMLLGSVGFVVLGVLFLVNGGSALHVVVGAIAVFFFGLCGVLLAVRIVRGGPELVLDEAGLEHVQLGRIAWDEIAAVRLRQVTGQLFIELVLHDPAGYVARAPRIVRMSAAANRGIGYGPANISANTLPVGTDEVIAAMVRHCPRLAVAGWSRPAQGWS
ncbi:STM3941 family protein [Kitasatospora sp. NPDC059571]|uniref:STM3941 family protein n=1 Tax=Kitasatospora sp. NPDC059571 TaxID=3346871 RepID=UPI0036C901FD